MKICWMVVQKRVESCICGQSIQGRYLMFCMRDLAGEAWLLGIMLVGGGKHIFLERKLAGIFMGSRTYSNILWLAYFAIFHSHTTTVIHSWELGTIIWTIKGVLTAKEDIILLRVGYKWLNLSLGVLTVCL